jgi:hypothetical protein
MENDEQLAKPMLNIITTQYYLLIFGGGGGSQTYFLAMMKNYLYGDIIMRCI